MHSNKVRSPHSPRRSLLLFLSLIVKQESPRRELMGCAAHQLSPWTLLLHYQAAFRLCAAVVLVTILDQPGSWTLVLAGRKRMARERPVPRLSYISLVVPSE